MVPGLSSIGGFIHTAAHGGYRHRGWDLFARHGAGIFSPETLKILKVYVDKIGGLSALFSDARGRKHYTTHHSAVHVKEGQTVPPRTRIASIGAAGNAKGTPAHTHWGVFGNYDSPWDHPARALAGWKPAASRGGITTRDSLVRAGEAGAEALIPLERGAGRISRLLGDALLSALSRPAVDARLLAALTGASGLRAPGVHAGASSRETHYHFELEYNSRTHQGEMDVRRVFRDMAALSGVAA
jgi:hypothetical protein